MARRELGPASLAVAHAVASVLPSAPVVIGCSGGADSLALALGARWAGTRCGAEVRVIVIDHGLQDGSDEVARRVVELLTREGMTAESRRVRIDADAPGGTEAAAREVRLAALASDGFPVLLGHTLDDQAESVLLGLLRGSGTRSLAGMAGERGPFIRPLLGVRRAATVQACAEWDVEPWEDPHNTDDRFRRVRARGHLEELSGAMGADVAPALARTASLARMDADLLDQLAVRACAGHDLTRELPVEAVAGLPDALRLRVLRDWLLAHGAPNVAMVHVMALDLLLRDWRGQGAVGVPGGRVERRGSALHHSRT
ncbi:MAG: tRNA lysidine(34) synthetase TilS [Propionibacteriaceae bacterium]|nr:tRNA lysidine(34) synthetase TilS [Propionibacteriaceae bacterium]